MMIIRLLFLFALSWSAHAGLSAEDAKALQADIAAAIAKRVDVVVPPPVKQYAKPDIMDLDLVSLAAVKAYINQYNMSGNFTGADAWGNPDGWGMTNKMGNGQFMTDPANGLHYLRVEIGTGLNNLRAINWLEKFGQDGVTSVQPRDELYVAYSIRIDPDVIVGMNPALLGAKLSGAFANDNYTVAIAEHSLREPQIAGSVSLNAYSYSKEGDQRVDYFGGDGTYQKSARANTGRWVTLEQHVRMNTPLVSDGVHEWWVDGVPVFSRSNVNWRAGDMWVKWSGVQWQFYHGGQGNSLFKPVHYDVARLRISTQRIGLPPELQPAP